MDLALPSRSFPTERRDVEISAALDRQVRCSHRELSRIQTEDEASAARFDAGNRSVYDKESSTKRQGNRRAARALQDSDRSAVGRANFTVRSVERSQGRGGGI